jgi:hypothetical protein
MAFQIDDAAFPVVVMRILGEYTDAEQSAFLEELEQLLRRRTRFVGVLDLSRGGGATALQRKRWADWIAAHDAELRRWVPGMSLVISSMLVRGMVTAVFWLRPMPIPTKTVETLAEAKIWARSQLQSQVRPAP